MDAAASGHYYLILEFVDGVNLRQMEQAQRLSPAEALSIIPKICDALQYAHEEGVVHRDIKPENILMDKRGRVKIADFGLAKLLGRAQSDYRLTGTHAAMGTLHYMAPEQIEHASQVDHRADIYSLGVVFYEMLTGELPIGRFPLPSQKVQVDVRLDDVVLRSLEKEPARRYQHASEIKTDVETIAQTPPPQPAPPPSPKLPVIAGYEILAELGSNQTAKVYRARELALNRVVVLKVLSPEAAANAHFLARFRREAQAAASLNHPNLVRIYESCESDGRHFIAMEHVEGETLGERLARKGRIEPREAMAICVYVAQGLAHGWEKVKLLHRDIKPDSIYLSKTGVVKLGGFGCARSATCERDRITQAGEQLGTPYYISPEQVRGNADVDLRADIYSLGGVLYHILSGQPPYDGPNVAAVMMKHATEPPPAILKVLPECPKPIAFLLSRMLEKDPRDRHQNYEDLIENLLRIHGELGGESAVTKKRPASAKTSPPIPAPTKKKSPALLYAAAISLAALLTAGLFVWAPWKTQEVERGKRQEQAARPGSAGVPPAAEPKPQPKEEPKPPVAAAPTVSPQAEAPRKDPSEPVSPHDMTRQAGEFCKELAFIPYEPPEGTGVGGIEWSPRGEPVLFGLYAPRKLGFRGDTTFAIDVGTKRISPWIVQGLMCPKFFPDGQTLAASRLNDNGIVMVNLADRKVTDVIGAISRRPTFARDGRRMCFGRFENGWNIWIANSDGSGQRQITFKHRWAADPDVSPTDDLVAYTAEDGLSVLRFDGTVLLRMVSVGGPRWAKDGTTLTFIGVDKNIWAMDTNGKAMIRITNERGRIEERVLSPDETQLIYYVKGSNGNGFKIVSVDLAGIRQRLGVVSPAGGTSIQPQPLAPAPSSAATSPPQTPAAAVKTQPGQPLVLDFGSGVTMELVYVPPGEFMLGSTKEERSWAVADGADERWIKREGEQPRKAAIKQAFWLGRTEVTVGQWKRFVAATSYVTEAEKKGGSNWKEPDFGFKLEDNHPAPCISWNDAMAFCAWLNEQEAKAGRLPPGYKIRLPTEAEWEYACRAGTQTKFWWGDKAEDGEGRSNWAGTEDGFAFVSPVDYYGARGRNKFGLADMLGNVWEWCLDEFDERSVHEECWKNANPGTRVKRSGSFRARPYYCRSANAIPHHPSWGYQDTGFRLALGRDVEGTAVTPIQAPPTTPAPAGTATPPGKIPAATAPPTTEDAFVKEVATLLPEQQVARVMAKLKELNPNFDGKETHKIENGAVTELSISTASVTDISPLAALKGLKRLSLAPYPGQPKSPLVDLSPLKGLPLTMLWCQNTSVNYLSALEGMPLTLLSCGNTDVWTLWRLRGMPLTVLSCDNTIVSDLSPLEGMPLTTLWCNNTKVTDLSPLARVKGPLRELRCDFKPERDTAILRGIKTLTKINDTPAATFWMKSGSAGILPAPVRTISIPAAGKMPALPGTATPAVTAATPTPATDGFVPLFNGRDLTGWTPMRTSGVQGNEHQPTTGGWTVHNNELVCNSDSSGWLKSERQYDNFVLQLEFKLRPDGNSGVYIRSPGSGRLSRTGMEIQITDEHVILKRGHTMQPNWATGAIYDVAGTSQPPLRPMGEWNLMEIRCQGDDVEVMLNGTRTASANMSQEPKLRDRPRSGYIGIANWPADAKGMAFRNIRIKDLSTKPAATTLTPGQGTGPTTATPAATTKAQSGQPFITSTGMELVWIPPGEFMMGSTSEEQRWADANGYALKYSKNEGEQPRKATIKQGYWLGRTEVTVGQWKQFVAATGHVTDAEKKGETYAPTVPGGLFGKAVGANWKDPNFGFKLKDNHPACCISWNDAVAFCKWLNDLEQKAGRLPAGFQVRLPAEVEWEYACRAGTQTKFWWGDTVEGGEGRLNWRRDGDGFRFVSPVDHYGARGRNKFGLADMLGNVWEWCCDEEYDIRRAQEGRSEGDSAWRVMRGGSFLYDPSFNRCANREVHFPNNASAPNGFRVAVGPPR